MSIEKCMIIELPKISDTRGNLTFVEENKHIPFNIKKMFCLFGPNCLHDDITKEAASHTLKKCEQFLIAMSGSFDVVLDDGLQKKKYHLNRSYYGLYIFPNVWREINNFSSGSVCMALASDYYDEVN